MRAAAAADARVIVVADIDRGGAFAGLYGTWALLPEQERALIDGFVLNKFRGDERLLPPAPQRLEGLTGVPTLGVLPWLRHGLPDEDGAFVTRIGHGPRVGVVRYPTASNLDELKPLEEVAHVRWLVDPSGIDDLDLVVLPGSKHVAADLAWLRATGIAEAIVSLDRPVLGICGGMQMLGERIDDPVGVDGSAEGLGLLPLRTEFRRRKVTGFVSGEFGKLDGFWNRLSGTRFSGYEIRHGATSDLVVGAGRVLGIAFHGLFEQPELVARVAGRMPTSSLEDVFDQLADAVEEHLDIDALLWKRVAA
jgi:adenosylcobyric acid synthase